jgi:hypothetical protein
MFLRDTEDPAFNLGIEVHQFINYRREGTIMQAKASFDKTNKEFSVTITPDYELFHAIRNDDGAPAQKGPNNGRSKDIHLGNYNDLDLADEIFTDVENHFLKLLKERGAEKHLLLDKGNALRFEWDDAAADVRLGEAAIQARTLYVFDQVSQDKPIDHLTLAGRIMPVLMHAVGIKNYAVDQDLSKDGYSEASFVIGGIAIFKIFKPLHAGKPCYFQRFEHKGGDDYKLTSEHDAYGQAVQGEIIEWLANKMAARAPLPRDDYNGYMGELALDVKRLFLTASAEKIAPTKLILPKDKESAVILNLADFRPR